MIEDLRRHEDGTELEADLCLVGAGAAGIAIARELAGSTLRVTLVESGGLKRSAETDVLNEGETAGLGPESLTSGRGRLLGGATALWAGQCLPLERSALARRPWVAHSGWPIGHDDLEPFYPRAEDLFRIRGEAYDERVWDEFGIARPSVDPRRLGHQFTVWCPEPNLGRLYRRTLAASQNVRVLLHATATELRTDSSGSAFQSVKIATPEGKSAVLRARACVLCTGAVENARLLLASNGVHAAGLGNGHDMVGRFFQDHPNSHCAVVESLDVRQLQDLYGLLYRGRVRYLPRLVLTAARQESEQVLGCAAYPVFHFGEESGMEALRRLSRALRARQAPERPWRDVRLVARESHRGVSATYRRARYGRSPRLPPAFVTLQTHAEQAPNPDSRVTLSRRRDLLGVPLPKVDWRLTSLDRRTAEVMVHTVAEEFRLLGLGEVRPQPWLADQRWAHHASDSFHHMGTTRLGSDPTTGVADPDCQIHGVRGLFVAGASVFPAAGFANPTLTIVALAIRLADHLKSTVDRLPAICSSLS
jgi:choline dehydrogenase-like flavoprotein